MNPWNATHPWQQAQDTVLLLAAIARALDRVLVLPWFKYRNSARPVRSEQVVQLRALSDLVRWRESGFFGHPRTRVNVSSFASLLVGRHRIGAVSTDLPAREFGKPGAGEWWIALRAASAVVPDAQVLEVIFHAHLDRPRLAQAIASTPLCTRVTDGLRQLPGWAEKWKKLRQKENDPATMSMRDVEDPLYSQWLAHISPRISQDQEAQAATSRHLPEAKRRGGPRGAQRKAETS